MRLMSAVLGLLFLLSGETACAQDRIYLDGLDAAAYPLIRGRMRILEKESLLQTIDSARCLAFEEGIGRTISISCPDMQTVPASVAVGLERSLDASFPGAKSAAQRFLRGLQFTTYGDEASLWAFATFIDHPVSISRDSVAMERELGNVSVASFPFNGTPLYETLYRAVDEVASLGPTTNRAAVFFTDGVDNTSLYSRTADNVAMRALATGVRIYVVSIGDKPQGVAAMTQLCNRTGGFCISVSHPKAFDSLTVALHAQPVETYWCPFEFTTPFCANGTPRTIRLQYVSTSGDTLSTSGSYTAPFREAELAPFPLWMSPRSIVAVPGDTLWIAIGATTTASQTVQPFRLDLQHDGLTRIPGERRSDAFASWQTFLSGSNRTSIRIDPGLGNPLAQGEQVILRIPYLVANGGNIRIILMLQREASDCRMLGAADPERSMVVTADTVFAERMRPAIVPVLCHGVRVPEGVQRVAFECSIQVSDAHFDIDRPFELDPAWSGATIKDIRFSLHSDLETIDVSCSGPPIDGPDTLGWLRLSVLPHAGYEIPVTLQRVTVNDFAAPTNLIVGQGLLVLRDSCRNNLVTLRNFFLSRPAPHPVSTVCRFQVITRDACSASIDVRDLQGNCVSTFSRMSFFAGTNQIELPMTNLVPGLYIIRVITGGECRTFPIVVDR